MKNLLRLVLVLTVSIMMAWAVIPRVAEIPAPESDLNVGGIGNLIGGVDIDEDGLPEIYVVNDNWGDTAEELKPRIYKLEKESNGTAWNVVWSSDASTFVPQQNTWPALELGDLDGDGKMELIWGVVNYTTTEDPNPYRILVYEHTGGDNFGYYNSSADRYEPTSMWTISDTDDENIRPMRFIVEDVDDDSVDELLFNDRKGTSNGYFFGVASVDDIPDDASGTETWTLELSGHDFDMSGEENKWDIFLVNGKFYLSCELHLSQFAYDGSSWNYEQLDPLSGGACFRSAQVNDLDADGMEEVVVGEYSWGSEDKAFKVGVDNGDSLDFTNLFVVDTMTALLNGGRIAGGAQGDIDADGNPDFIFGSRYAGPPNAQIYRLEYNGGTVTDVSNWEMTLADTSDPTFAPGVSGIWDVISVGQTDTDEEDEIIYTSSVPGDDGTFPIIILDSYETVGVEHPLAPASFELGEAYPNPFNPETVIPFTLDESSNISLMVFDIQGNCVADLIHSENYDAGNYNINFNASSLASGVYFYQLRVDNTIRAGKMVLNK